MAGNLIGSDPQTQSMLAQMAQQYGGIGAIPQIQKSQYLAQALQSIGESASSNIKSPGALGSNLLAEALLQYARSKSDKALIGQITQQQGASLQHAEDAAGYNLPPTQPAPDQAAPAPPIQPPASFAASPPATAPQAAGPASPDRRLLAEALAGEAGNQGAQGMGAVRDVVNNRARMSGLSIADVLNAPHQFESMDNPKSRARLDAMSDSALAPEYASIDGNAPVVSPTTTNFLNPDLQAKLGRAQPAWATGNGQRIGDQVFYQGNYAAPPGMRPPIPPQAPPMVRPPVPSGSTVNMDPQAPQMGAGGPPMAQGNQPPPQPQMPSQGQPQAPQGQPQPSQGLQPLMGLPMNPTERAQITWGLQQPQGSAAWMAASQRLQEIAQRVSTQRPYHIVNQNGVNVAIDDATGQQSALPVPQGVQSHNQTPEQAGISAPPGTTFSTDPLGNSKSIYAPQPGQQVTSAPGQPYAERPITGGTNDITGGKSGFDAHNTIRSAYESAVAPFLNQQQAYGQIKATEGNSSHAGQMSMIMAFVHLANPQARAGTPQEAIAAANSGEVPSFVSTALAKLMGGPNALLSPDEEAQFRQTADSLYSSAKAQADATFGAFAQQDPTGKLIKVPDLQLPGGGGQRLSPQEAAKLPPGTHFIGQDGVERVRQ